MTSGPRLAAALLATLALSAITLAQQPAAQPAAASTPRPDAPRTDAPRRQGPRGPVVVSPEVKGDRQVVFRILALKAEAVRLNAGDLPGSPGQARNLTKGENGVWELTLGPVDAGTYRYTFDVD